MLTIRTDLRLRTYLILGIFILAIVPVVGLSYLTTVYYKAMLIEERTAQVASVASVLSLKASQLQGPFGQDMSKLEAELVQPSNIQALAVQIADRYPGLGFSVSLKDIKETVKLTNSGWEQLDTQDRGSNAAEDRRDGWHLQPTSQGKMLHYLAPITLSGKVLGNISGFEPLSSLNLQLRRLYWDQAWVLAGSLAFALLVIGIISRAFRRKLEMTAQVIRSNAGKKIKPVDTCPEFSKIIDFINDHTGQARHELHLQQNILNNLPLGLIATTPDGRIAFVNDQVCQLLGFKPDDLLGITFKDLKSLTAAEAYDKELEPLNDWYAGKIIKDFELKITHKDGSEGSIEVSVYPFTDKSGKNQGGLALVQDSSLKSNYMMLKNWSKAVIERLHSGLIAVDREQHIIVFNRAARELFELPTEQVIGEPITNSVPQSVQAIISQNLLTGKSSTNQSLTISVAGKDKMLLLNTAVIQDERGVVSGAAAVLQDVTELRMIQARMSEQEKLAVVGQMAAGMAHELRNPLTTVRGFIQLMHDRMLKDNDNREYFELIMQEIDRTNQIIRDFLILAKPKPPVLTLHPINLLLQELLPLMESQCLLNNIRVNTYFARMLPPAVLDPDQIKQVLLNLIQNAVQSMAGRQNAVLNLQTSFDKEKKMVVITVGDNGEGISVQNMAKLGTPFFTTKDHGTGLGLSVSYRIVEAHRGKILVESQPGKGAVFKILLPVGYI